jgi:hypothetical protein
MDVGRRQRRDHHHREGNVMKQRLIAPALAGLLAAAPAQAWIGQKGGSSTPPTSQVMVFHSTATSNLSNAADRWLPLAYTGGSVSTEDKSLVFPVAGTITALKFTTQTQPTGSASYTATVRVNGASTAATCTVNSSTAICDWSGSVAVNAGDYATVMTHPANSPTATTGGGSIVFQPATPGDVAIVSAARTAAFSTSAVQGTVPMSGSTPGTVSASGRRHGILPDSGTLDRLYVNTNAPGTTSSGDKYDWAMLKNGAAPSPQPACTTLETATTCNDTSNAFTNNAADDIEFRGTPTNATALNASNAVFGLRWRPTCSGFTSCFPLIMTTSANELTSGTTYYQPQGGNAVGSTTEANVQIPVHSMTLRRMYVKLLAAPGTGVTRTYTVRKNGVDTGMTCGVTGTNTTCSITTGADVTVAENDKITISSVVSGGTAVSTQAGVALLATR